MNSCRAWIIIGSLVLPVSIARAEIELDTQLPAGNIVFERAESDHLYLHQDQRDSTQWWFYWAFRVCGAEGRMLTFHFTDGEPVGTRGPAVSSDRGIVWRWLSRDFTQKSFTYHFSPDESEVWFAFGMVYTQRDWDRFIAQHKDSPFIELGELATTRKGRPVEKLRLGCVTGVPHHRVLLTARHHACEMMASYVVEGFIEGVLADNDEAAWLRQNVEFLVVPFVDKDGVEDGDQGKNRAPRDHNRDYDDTSVYVETAAIRQQVPDWADGRLSVAIDLHCPHIRGPHNECVYQVGSSSGDHWAAQQRFGKLLEAVAPHPLSYRQTDDLPFGEAWNTGTNYSQGLSFGRWAAMLPGVRLSTSLEIPYATANGTEVNVSSARQLGANMATALQRYLISMEREDTAQPPLPAPRQQGVSDDSKESHHER